MKCPELILDTMLLQFEMRKKTVMKIGERGGSSCKFGLEWQVEGRKDNNVEEEEVFAQN